MPCVSVGGVQFLHEPRVNSGFQEMRSIYIENMSRSRSYLTEGTSVCSEGSGTATLVPAGNWKQNLATSDNDALAKTF